MGVGGSQNINKARSWAQDPYNPFYQAAARAIQRHWRVPPNFVCEGGTLRMTPFLEHALGAPALHLPLAQATDNAHVAVGSAFALRAVAVQGVVARPRTVDGAGGTGHQWGVCVTVPGPTCTAFPVCCGGGGGGGGAERAHPGVQPTVGCACLAVLLHGGGLPDVGRESAK
jgi:hypothetical protein